MHSPIIHIVPSDLLLSIRLLNSSQQRLRIGANNLSDLLLVLEDDECRHGADTELLRDVWDFVYVDLNEMDVGEVFGEPVACTVSFRSWKETGRGRTDLTT